MLYCQTQKEPSPPGQVRGSMICYNRASNGIPDTSAVLPLVDQVLVERVDKKR